jgi:hypothetical protein
MKYKSKPREIEAIAFIPMNKDKLIEAGVKIASKHTSPLRSLDNADFWTSKEFEVYNKLHNSWIGIKLNDFINVTNPEDHYPIDSEVFRKTYEAAQPDKWRQYIGCKLITALPMSQGQFLSMIKKEKDVGDKAFEIEGYIVKYADGYESWSPKETFELAYREVTPQEVGMFNWSLDFNKEIG